MLRVDCISDLHGYLPELPGGDLLIVAGDLTARDSLDEYQSFSFWLINQEYKKKIVIAGNHDTFIEREPFKFDPSICDCEYLCDSGTEFEGLKIWGSPWTAQFPGINPHCCAFTEDFGCDTEFWLDEHWALIPEDTDILITHSPPYGCHDLTDRGEHVGSKTLAERLCRIKPKLHVFGHIHEAYGTSTINGDLRLVNASHVNGRYYPTNKCIRVLL